MISLIVTAAGKGERLGQTQGKALLPYNGKPILIHALEKFVDIPEITEVIVTSNKMQENDIRECVKSVSFPWEISVILGAETRAESVKNAVEAATEEWVLIHDAARPFVSSEVIKRVLEKRHSASAIIPAIPETDTIKWIQNGLVKTSLDRNEVMKVQTPQLFLKEALVTAYGSVAIKTMTDEAMILESLNIPIHVVAGDIQNKKITYKEDL